MRDDLALGVEYPRPTLQLNSAENVAGTRVWLWKNLRECMRWWRRLFLPVHMQCKGHFQFGPFAAEVAKIVRRASRIVALTGAGISVESGLQLGSQSMYFLLRTCLANAHGTSTWVLEGITPFRLPSSSDGGSAIWAEFDARQMTVPRRKWHAHQLPSLDRFERVELWMKGSAAPRLH